MTEDHPSQPRLRTESSRSSVVGHDAESFNRVFTPSPLSPPTATRGTPLSCLSNDGCKSRVTVNAIMKTIFHQHNGCFDKLYRIQSETHKGGQTADYSPP